MLLFDLLFVKLFNFLKSFMIKKTLLFIISFSLGFSYAQVGINTESPQAALHIEGDLIIKNTSPKSTSNADLKPLFVDPDGYVVRAIATQASTPATTIQTTREIINSSLTPNRLTAFNGGTPQSIILDESDIVINNLGVTVQNGNLRIPESGIYQISTLINYIFGTNTNGSKIFINIYLETSSNNGAIWYDVVGYRPIFTIDWAPGQSTPAVLPTAIVFLSQGDLLRYSFYRTKSGTTLQGDALTSLAVAPAYSTPSVSATIVKL